MRRMFLNMLYLESKLSCCCCLNVARFLGTALLSAAQGALGRRGFLKINSSILFFSFLVNAHTHTHVHTDRKEGVRSFPLEGK